MEDLQNPEAMLRRGLVHKKQSLERLCDLLVVTQVISEAQHQNLPLEEGSHTLPHMYTVYLSPGTPQKD